MEEAWRRLVALSKRKDKPAARKHAARSERGTRVTSTDNTSYPTVDPNAALILAEDEQLVTPFTFYTMSQCRPCNLDIKGNGSRSNFAHGCKLFVLLIRFLLSCSTHSNNPPPSRDSSWSWVYPLCGAHVEEVLLSIGRYPCRKLRPHPQPSLELCWSSSIDEENSHRPQAETPGTKASSLQGNSEEIFSDDLGPSPQSFSSSSSRRWSKRHDWWWGRGRRSPLYWLHSDGRNLGTIRPNRSGWRHRRRLFKESPDY